MLSHFISVSLCFLQLLSLDLADLTVDKPSLHMKPVLSFLYPAQLFCLFKSYSSIALTPSRKHSPQGCHTAGQTQVVLSQHPPMGFSANPESDTLQDGNFTCQGQNRTCKNLTKMQLRLSEGSDVQICET